MLKIFVSWASARLLHLTGSSALFNWTHQQKNWIPVGRTGISVPAWKITHHFHFATERVHGWRRYPNFCWKFARVTETERGLRTIMRNIGQNVSEKWTLFQKFWSVRRFDDSCGEFAFQRLMHVRRFRCSASLPSTAFPVRNLAGRVQLRDSAFLEGYRRSHVDWASAAVDITHPHPPLVPGFLLRFR